MKLRPIHYHLIAIFAITVWGLTFISTKLLIQNGISPQEIFLFRFVIAYLGIWLIAPKRLFARSFTDELWLLAGGACGGSIYFLTENTALQITQASNVAFIICTTPLLTVFLSHLFYKDEKLSKQLLLGSLVALFGVALVIFNGRFILQINPLGDILTLLASLSWAFFSLIVRKMGDSYSSSFITRKVFFYGIVTVLPFFIITPIHLDITQLLQPIIWGNLLFLGVMASLVCFVLWSIVLKQLGTIKSSNYIYLNPLVTMIASLLILHEDLTWIALLGASCILLGVYWGQKK